jgi:transcriptional regulator with GAF, ATPase, and Fis domain
MMENVKKVAHTDTTVLITGETGVGKELVATAIFNHSSRVDKSFIRVNCSAFSESLIASELFGYEKGAFTGAHENRAGRFELADGGTLFLDEIGDIPMEVQIRLLRVLQSKEFERVGSSRTLHSEFRLIAATHQNLSRLVKENRFREDLFYRLNVFPIHVPALRDRKEDIPLLVRHFLSRFEKKARKQQMRIGKAEMRELCEYDWPGNIRELEHVIERGVIMSTGSVFKLPELTSRQTIENPVASSPEMTLLENEKQYVLSVLNRTKWKISGPGGCAEILNIHPNTLASRMKKLGISRKKAGP